MKPVLPFKITTALHNVIAIMALLVVVGGFTGPARAACTNPAGNEGVVIYNEVYATMQFCDDTNWIPMEGMGDRSRDLLSISGVGDWESGEDDFLGWTPTVTASSNTMQTLSFWIKRESIGNGSGNTLFGSWPGGAANERSWAVIGFDDRLYLGLKNAANQELQLFTGSYYFSDTTNWHHLLIQYDMTQPTVTDRIKLWVDGVSIALGTVTTDPVTTISSSLTAGSQQRVGAIPGSTVEDFDGLIAEFHAIDGAIVPYGAFYSSGMAVPYNGSYGNNGFYLKFADATNLGADSSGRGNNFTNTGVSLVTNSYPNSGGAAPSSGLIVHLPLNETSGTTAEDIAGNYDGSYVNGPAPTTGRIGGAYDFTEGSNQSVLIPHNAALNLPQYSLSAWVFPDPTELVDGDEVDKIFDKDAAYTMNWDHPWVPVSCEHYDGSWLNTGTGPTLSPGQWYHLACTYDGSNYIMYVNGQEVSRDTGVAPPLAFGNDLRLGSIHNGGDYFDGIIDDARIYNRALTSAEVYGLATSGTTFNYRYNGYFVETAETDGNMGGLPGADALCLSRLQAGSWLGKTAALANGQLNAANVKAWLCSTSECRNLDKLSTYRYASTLYPTAGGTTMSIDANGFTEDDGHGYGDAPAFGTGSFRTYFTGRTQANTPATDTCSNWTTEAGTTEVAVSDTGFYGEKLSKYSGGCDWQHMICMVGAQGGCASPVAEAGSMHYDPNSNMMRFCNGKQWVPMSARFTVPHTENLVAHYRFEHTSGTSLTDFAGGHTGTLFNFTLPAAWTAGHIGANALDFDGNDDYVSLASPGDFAFVANEKYTWAMWINPDDFEEWNAVFGTYINPNSAPTFAIDVHTTADGNWGPVTAGISAGMDQPGNLLNAHSTNNVLTVGTWSHVTVTYDGALAQANRFKIYVNGVDVTSPDIYTLGTLGNSTPTNVRLAHNGWTDEFFDGRMDDFRFYKRLLSLDEIKALAAYGPATGSCANPTGTTGSMIYNNTANVVQFCNGKDWVAAGR